MRSIAVAVTVAIAIASGGCGSKTSKNNVPPAKDDATPVAVDRDEPPAIAPAEIAPVLGLADDKIAEVRAYESKVLEATTSKTPEATCTALASAYALADSLQMPLLERRDALFDKPEYDALIAAVKQLSESLRGVGFAVGAATLYAWVDNGDFAFAGKPAAAALAIADKLLTTYPSWMVQKTDLGGCVEHQGAVAPIERYRADWAAAPDCIKTELGPRIRDSLDSMAGSLCFCGDKAAAQQGADQVAKLLAGVADLKGDDLAAKLRASAADSGAQFECSGP